MFQTMMESQAQKRGPACCFQKFETTYFVNADHSAPEQVLINLCPTHQVQQTGGAVA